MTKLKGSTCYTVRVRDINDTGCGAYNTAAYSTLPDPLPPLAAPPPLTWRLHLDTAETTLPSITTATMYEVQARATGGEAVIAVNDQRVVLAQGFVTLPISTGQLRIAGLTEEAVEMQCAYRRDAEVGPFSNVMVLKYSTPEPEPVSTITLPVVQPSSVRLTRAQAVGIIAALLLALLVSLAAFR